MHTVQNQITGYFTRLQFVCALAACYQDILAILRLTSAQMQHGKRQADTIYT